MDMNLCQLVQHYFVSSGRWQDTEGMAKISGGCALLAPMEWQLGGMWETHSFTWLPSCVCLPSPVSFPSVQWQLSVHSSDPQHPLGQHPAYPPSWHLIGHLPALHQPGPWHPSRRLSTHQPRPVAPSRRFPVDQPGPRLCPLAATMISPRSEPWRGGGTLFQVCSFFRFFPWALK